jgi:adenylate cyclase, class 2
MGQEYETQIVDFDKEQVIKKLRELGAKEEPEILQKRWVFDIKCSSGKDVGLGEWIRLREVRGKSVLTYKNKRGRGIDETEEVEVEVSDFEKTAQILSKLTHFAGKYYQENKRHKFILNEIEFTIDTWPKIPTILEIEAQNEEKVNEGLKILNLTGKDLGHVGLPKIYDMHKLNIHAYKELRFE